MKLNQELIQQLSNGEIAVENNGTLEQLREVIKAAFPKPYLPHGSYKFYLKNLTRKNEWNAADSTTLPIISVADFYQPDLFTGWAKDDNYPGWMVYFKKDIPTFGFDSLGVWQESDSNFNYSKDEGNRPATNEEIEATLIKEAKRRGYKGGDTIKGIHRTTHKRPKIGWLYYDADGDRLLTDLGCIVYEEGEWAEIIEKPQPNPIHYLVDDMKYSFNYQELKAKYESVVNYSDEVFMNNLPEITHLACIISYFKGLGVQATISDKGIIHELIHLMTDPEEPTNDLAEIREKFNKLIQLV